MIIQDQASKEHDASGRFHLSFIMFALTCVAFVLNNHVLEVFALGINTGCWGVMTSGARRDLKQLRATRMSVPKREHTGMYRGGF